MQQNFKYVKHTFPLESVTTLSKLTIANAIHKMDSLNINLYTSKNRTSWQIMKVTYRYFSILN